MIIDDKTNLTRKCRTERIDYFKPFFIALVFRFRDSITASPSAGEGVSDDRDRTQAHCGTGDDQTEQQAKEQVKHAGRHRDSQRVVENGKDEILPNVAHNGAAQANGLRDAAEVAFYQRDARALHGHVGAGTHGDTDVGFTQSRCVIDAVASHGDVFAFLTELFDMGHFLHHGR